MFTAENLKENEIIGKLGDETIERIYAFLAPETVLRQVPAGYVVIEEGEVPEEVVFLLSGSTRSSAINAEGQERVAGYTKERCSILTLFLPLLTRTAHFSRITTSSPSQLAIVPAETFMRAMDCIQPLYKAVAECAFKRAVRATNYNHILRLKGARNRVCSMLLLECTERTGYKFSFRFTYGELAVFINLARPTFSREVHELEKMGLIKLDKHCIELLEPEKVRSLLET